MQWKTIGWVGEDLPLARKKWVRKSDQRTTYAMLWGSEDYYLQCTESNPIRMKHELIRSHSKEDEETSFGMKMKRKEIKSTQKLMCENLDSLLSIVLCVAERRQPWRLADKQTNRPTRRKTRRKHVGKGIEGNSNSIHINIVCRIYEHFDYKFHK